MKKKKKSVQERAHIGKFRMDANENLQATAFCKSKCISKDTAFHDAFFERLSIYPLQFNKVVNLLQRILQSCSIAENEIKNNVEGKMGRQINGQTSLFQGGNNSKGLIVINLSLQEIQALANEIINQLKS
jgi:hypothetical protein